MTIAGYAIAYLGLVLQFLMLWRCFKTKLWRQYPYFFNYFAYTLISNAVGFVFLVSGSASYRLFYWIAYLIGSVVRFAVAWEVFRWTFPRESTLRRIAGVVLVAVLLSLALTFFLNGPRPGDYIVADVLRKMSLAVALWLLTVLGLARLYSVRLSRNVWGMAVGLFIFVSSQIIAFSALDISPLFRPLWNLMVPFGFIVMISIWNYTIWASVPKPRPVVPIESAPLEALRYWEHRWASIDSALKKVLKP